MRHFLAAQKSGRESHSRPDVRFWAKRNQQRSWLREIFSRSHDAVIRVYDEAGNVIETHEHAGGFKSGERGKQKAVTR
jgi:hypothetical protein